MRLTSSLWLGDKDDLAFEERVGVGLQRLGGLFANVEYESKFAHGPAESAPPFPDLARTTTYPFTRDPYGRIIPATTGAWIPAGALDARGCRGKAALCIRAYIRIFVSRAWKGPPVAVLDARAQDLVSSSIP